MLAFARKLWYNMRTEYLPVAQLDSAQDSTLLR